jgi:hypothetical protein
MRPHPPSMKPKNLYTSKSLCASYACKTKCQQMVLWAFCNLWLGAAVLLSSSCGSYTEVTSLTYFPTNATHHTEYTLQVEAHGQPGKAYSAFGRKRVFVVVFHMGAPLGQTEYTVEAGHLDWEVRWDEFSSPQIRFFESENRTNTIRTVALRIDPSAKAGGRFTDQR